MANNDVTITLYGGKHTGEFTASNHRYKIDGDYKKGVTTIIGDVLAKPALMLWPLNECLRSIGAVWDEGTSQWCLTSESISINETGLRTAAKAYLTKRDKAADTGTDVHALVEKFLKAQQLGRSFTPQLTPETKKPWGAFVKWWESLDDPEVLYVEKVVYSETMDYAGMLDFVICIGDKVYLCDLKTTNASRGAPDGVYPEHFLQLGAYYFAYEEERAAVETLAPIDDLMIVSCQKNGQLRTKKASDIGLTPRQCAFTWADLISLYHFKDHLQRKLQGKETHELHSFSR